MDGWMEIFISTFFTICYLVLFRETANQRYTNDTNSNSFSNSEERKMARRCIFNIRICKTLSNSRWYSSISYFFYSEKTPSSNIIEVSNWIFRGWILYKKTILTFEGMFYGGMCLKRNFRLQIGKEVLCNDQEARGFDAETFRPAVLKSLAKYFFMRII